MYQEFSPLLAGETFKHIDQKDYNSETVDIVINTLTNVYFLTIKVLKEEIDKGTTDEKGNVSGF